jgi:hypothetical protein
MKSWWKREWVIQSPIILGYSQRAKNRFSWNRRLSSGPSNQIRKLPTGKSKKWLKNWTRSFSQLIGAICLGLAMVVYAVGGAALRTGNFSGVVVLMIMTLAAWGLTRGLSPAKGKSKWGIEHAKSACHPLGKQLGKVVQYVLLYVQLATDINIHDRTRPSTSAASRADRRLMYSDYRVKYLHCSSQLMRPLRSQE